MDRKANNKTDIQELEQLIRGLEIKEREIQSELRTARSIVARLSNDRTPAPRSTTTFQLGNQVTITNPKEGQPNQGRIIGFTRTGLANVEGTNPEGNKVIVRRATKNLSHYRP